VWVRAPPHAPKDGGARGRADGALRRAKGVALSAPRRTFVRETFYNLAWFWRRTLVRGNALHLQVI
jgi:hypothetical protein